MLNLFRFVLLRLVRLLYRIESRGSEHIPAEGGALLVPNHLTWIDAFLISALTRRRVRFVVYQDFLKVPVFGWAARISGAIPISGERPRDAIRVTIQALSEGHLVCLFPEGQLSRSGLMTELRKGIEVIAHKSHSAVIPIYMDGLWGSNFSFERGRSLFRWPRSIPRPVSIAVGEPLAPAEVKTELIRQRLQNLSVEAFSARPELRRPLPTAILDSLKRHPTRALFIEHSRPGSAGKNRRKVSRASAIAAAIALAARWRRSLPEEQRRIGILLPGGAASAFMNLGLVLAGRVPVNLPFGGDPRLLAEQLEQLGIRTVLTSRAFAPALDGFPWRCADGAFVDLRSEIDAAGNVRMLLERARACLEPKWMARRRLGFDVEPTAQSEAFGYLWRDGEKWRSTFLSHFQVQAATAQLFSGRILEQKGERLFCEQAMNTASGALFALWAPVLGDALCLGRSAAARSDASMVEAVLSAEAATLLVSSPELRAQIVEADDWHPTLAQQVQRIFSFETDLAGPGNADSARLGRITGVTVYHGWALDEAGFLGSLSLPDLPPAKARQELQTGRCVGSVGRLLPGTALAGDAIAGQPLRLRLPSPQGGEFVASAHPGSINEAGYVFLEAAEDDLEALDSAS